MGDNETLPCSQEVKNSYLKWEARSSIYCENKEHGRDKFEEHDFITMRKTGKEWLYKHSCAGCLLVQLNQRFTTVPIGRCV